MPTLQSIAEHCGVSHVTVWRALRENGNVHPETALRIRDHARKVGYSKDSDARTSNPRTRPQRPSQREASVLVPYNNPSLTTSAGGTLFWEYVAGITEAARQTGTRVQLMEFELQKEESKKQEGHRIRQLVHDGIDGVLDFGLSMETLKQLNAEDISIVSLLTSQEPMTRAWATIQADHIRGFFDAWNYLLFMGHQTVGFVGYEQTHASGLRRRECLAAGHLIDERLDLATDIRIPLNGTDADLWEALLRKLGPFESGLWPSAFFCTNDQIAHLMARTVGRHGIQVPKDISLVGFDNTAIAEEGIIPLTTLASPRKEIGTMMLYMLENMIIGRPGSRKANQVLPMQLIKRESVARIEG